MMEGEVPFAVPSEAPDRAAAACAVKVRRLAQPASCSCQVAPCLIHCLGCGGLGWQRSSRVLAPEKKAKEQPLPWVSSAKGAPNFGKSVLLPPARLPAWRRSAGVSVLPAYPAGPLPTLSLQCDGHGSLVLPPHVKVSAECRELLSRIFVAGEGRSVEMCVVVCGTGARRLAPVDISLLCRWPP